jgi:hypothetical protein
MKKFCLMACCMLFIITGAAMADIPKMVNHQGIVKVSGVPFTGTGFFKFGIVNEADNYLWTNDGTRLGQPSVTPPADAVTLGVVNGNYSVRLGDAALTNMVTIPATVFENDNVKLRVYFNDGVNGEVALLPDQPVTAVPYAYHAHTADTVPGYIDGGVLSNDETDPTNSLHITELICRDDQNIANIQVPAMSKRVDANWAAGDGNGGLDAGTIGASQVLVYVWAIGDSTVQNPGDILFSKSGLTPGLPGGYDVKRFIGARLWSGTEWSYFLTKGKGRTRWTYFLNSTFTVDLDAASEFTEVSISEFVPDGWSSKALIHLFMWKDTGTFVDDARVLLRPLGVAGSVQRPWVYGTVYGTQSVKLFGAQSIGPLGATAHFEYMTPNNEPLIIDISGFSEEL